jgi:hypothetical protein
MFRGFLDTPVLRVTETYYAKWVSSRKLRLERLLAESLVNA